MRAATSNSSMLLRSGRLVGTRPLAWESCLSARRWLATAKKDTTTTTAKSSGTTPLEASSLPDPRAFAQEKTFWSTQEPLKQKRLQAKERSEPHFVFLEGPGGAGKKDLLWRLNKMGHEVIFHPYLSFLLDSPYPYSPKRDHDILQVRWNNKIITALENITSLSKGGKAYKSNLVFVHRSPISSFHYARDRNPAEAALYLTLMRQLTTAFSSSVVLCKADPLRVQERLGERLMVPPEKEKALRRELGDSADLEVIQREMDAYERLLAPPSSGQRASAQHQHQQEKEQERYIDTVVHTTSSKQATAQILKTYGVEMNWVWEDLRKSTSPPAH